MIWFISDLHLFSTRDPLVDERGFKTEEDMRKAIIDGWKRRVQKGDTVYIVGDVADNHTRRTTEILRKLPGLKILIVGNHDLHNIRGNSRSAKEFRNEFFYITPFDSITVKGQKVILCHYPIEEWDGRRTGAIHVHGHVHINDSDMKIMPIENRYNASIGLLPDHLGVDGFAPKTLDELKAATEWWLRDQNN